MINNTVHTGTIIKGIAGRYIIDTGTECCECGARGKLRGLGITPMIGDVCDISIDSIDRSGDGAITRGSIEHIHPRKSMLIRPAVANIDQLVVVASVTSPEPNLELIDNFLITGEMNRLSSIICINKADLADTSELERIYSATGYRVVVTSAERNNGMDELKELLIGKNSALAGNSGVGKSSILNSLGIDCNLRTGAVSEKIQRGRHTTRHVELIKIPAGGMVLDTPGFSVFELPGVEAEDLEQYFPEFSEHLGGCRFRGCAHVHEPDCAVREALAQGRISERRYESYVHFYTELKNIKKYL